MKALRAPAALVVCPAPHHFAFALGCLWASDNSGGRVLRLEWRRVRVRRRVRLGAAPHGIAVVGPNAVGSREDACR